MGLLEGRDNQLEKGSFHHKRMMKEVQISKDSERKNMAAEEEDLTREVEVEEEAQRLPIDVTDVTLWVTDLLNVLRIKIRDSEVHTYIKLK